MQHAPEYVAVSQAPPPAPPPQYATAVALASPDTDAAAYGQKVQTFAIESHPTADTERNANAQGRSFNLNSSMGENKTILGIVGIVVGIAVLLLVILLPMSFSSLEYYQLGFMRRKSTGSVDTARVYGAGRHMVGPDFEFKKFPADAHFEKYAKVTVFAADRLQVSITANLQYFLRPHQLELLHKNFDIHYQPVLRNNALDALKGAATLFTTREYIRERMKVENALFKAVKERLGGRCCEKDCEDDKSCVAGCLSYSRCTEEDFGLFANVRYFQLAELDIPSDLEERYLQALVLQEETEGEAFKQEAQIVRKETEGMVKETENAAEEIAQGAESQSALTGTTAAANATAIVERARSQGLKHLYAETNLNEQEHRNSFDYLRTVMEKKDISLAIDFQQLIAGNL